MDSLFPLYGDALSPCGQITWSKGGIGCVRHALRIGAAFWVTMQPSVFLALATPLVAPRSSLKWLASQVDIGETLCPPSLEVWFPRSNAEPLVTRHDGRHRATLAAVLTQNAVMPVLLRLTGPACSNNAEAFLALARRGMRAQCSRSTVMGPLFGNDIAEDGKLTGSGIPPP